MARGNYIIPSTMNDITYYFLAEYYYFFFQLNKMETSYQKFKKLKVEGKKKIVNGVLNHVKVTP